MAPSDRNRRHFEVIAQAKREEEKERLLAELERPAIERIIEGLVLAEGWSADPAIEKMLDERALGQAELHRRARRLGLIK